MVRVGPKRVERGRKKLTAETLSIANALVGGGSIQGRPFTPHEAAGAVVATCNFGLERSFAAYVRTTSSSSRTTGTLPRFVRS